MQRSRNARPIRGPCPRRGRAREGGPSFGSLLKDVGDARHKAIGRKSDTQAQAVAMGKANMVDVVTAVAESRSRDRDAWSPSATR